MRGEPACSSRSSTPQYRETAPRRVAKGMCTVHVHRFSPQSAEGNDIWDNLQGTHRNTFLLFLFLFCTPLPPFFSSSIPHCVQQEQPVPRLTITYPYNTGLEVETFLMPEACWDICSPFHPWSRPCRLFLSAQLLSARLIYLWKMSITGRVQGKLVEVFLGKQTTHNLPQETAWTL